MIPVKKNSLLICTKCKKPFNIGELVIETYLAAKVKPTGMLTGGEPLMSAALLPAWTHPWCDGHVFPGKVDIKLIINRDMIYHGCPFCGKDLRKG